MSEAKEIVMLVARDGTRSVIRFRVGAKLISFQGKTYSRTDERAKGGYVVFQE